jgi:hypothetical protein
MWPDQNAFLSLNQSAIAAAQISNQEFLQLLIIKQLAMPSFEGLVHEERNAGFCGPANGKHIAWFDWNNFKVSFFDVVLIECLVLKYHVGRIWTWYCKCFVLAVVYRVSCLYERKTLLASWNDPGGSVAAFVCFHFKLLR